MAKVFNNIFVRGLTGSVGDQFVIKRTRSGKTIISNAPAYNENRVFSPAQLEVHTRFREAVMYAKDAKVQAVYVEKAQGTPLTAYNIAIADWFNQPEVLEIDTQEYAGEAGNVIRVRAMDDVQVAQVALKITDGDGTVLEQGTAVRVEGNWWHYTTQSATPSAERIVASARDLPGNVAQLEWED